METYTEKAPEDDLAQAMTHDPEMNFNKNALSGKEDTAKELQDHAAKTQNTLVDALKNTEVAEIKGRCRYGPGGAQPWRGAGVPGCVPTLVEEGCRHGGPEPWGGTGESLRLNILEPENHSTNPRCP